MNYKEMRNLCSGKQLPIFAKNENGENLVIERGREDDRHFYKTMTAQKNGWTRINVYYDDGSSDELFTRR